MLRWLIAISVFGVSLSVSGDDAWARFVVDCVKRGGDGPAESFKFRAYSGESGTDELALSTFKTVWVTSPESHIQTLYLDEQVTERQTLDRATGEMVRETLYEGEMMTSIFDCR